MKTRAAVAWKAGSPLSVETVDLEGPRAGEVLVELKATGICHTDWTTLSGADPEGRFPAIQGPEGAGVVLEVGAGVSTLRAGDHVIPLYTPECRQCKFCLSRKTNLCQQIRATQGRGLMPDGSSRFSIGGQPILHYMGTSTFANHIVVPEIALAKIRSDAPFDTVCYIGCGVTTGVGAVLFSAKVEAGANVVVFGLGGIGLNVVQGARLVGADKIIGVDLNPAREAMARSFGMTHFLNPSEHENIVDAIVQLTDGGADYSFECIGNTEVMRQALECTHKGWGRSIIIGVAEGAAESVRGHPMSPRKPPERPQSRRNAQPGLLPGEHLQRRVGPLRGLTRRAGASKGPEQGAARSPDSRPGKRCNAGRGPWTPRRGPKGWSLTLWISTRPFQLVTGRKWEGTAFGGARGRTDVPRIVDWYMEGKLRIDELITHRLPLERINEGFELMRRGESIRSVVVY